MRGLKTFPVPALALLVSAVLVAYLAMVSAASAQEPGCGISRVIIEGGSPSPFALPDNAEETLNVDPDAVLLVRGENPPPNATIRLSLSGTGFTLDRVIELVGTTPVSVDLADYSKYVRGVFQLEGTLLSGQREVCTTLFRAKISGLGGTVATVATAATTVDEAV